MDGVAVPVPRIPIGRAAAWQHGATQRCAAQIVLHGDSSEQESLATVSAAGVVAGVAQVCLSNARALTSALT